jgi:hypothetical protein
MKIVAGVFQAKLNPKHELVILAEKIYQERLQYRVPTTDVRVSVRPTRQNEKLEEGQGPDSIELFAWR